MNIHIKREFKYTISLSEKEAQWLCSILKNDESPKTMAGVVMRENMVSALTAECVAMETDYDL